MTSPTIHGPRSTRGRHASASRVVPFPTRPGAAAPGAAPSGSTEVRSTSETALNGHVLALLSLVAVLTMTGLVMVLSASSVASQVEYDSPWFHFGRQVMWVAAGVVALVLASRVDLALLRRHVGALYWITIGLLVAVLVPGVGQNVNGSSRWLGVGPFTFQPSELAKLVLLVFAADLLTRRARNMDRWRVTMLPVMLAFGGMAALIMFQPNLGTTLLLFMIVTTILFVAGVPRLPLVAATSIGAVGAALAAVVEPYRRRRLLAFMDPWADPAVTGYQTLQGRAALANGGTVGQGLGEGRAKFGFLPEGHTDFIFANLGEELGLIGSLVLLAMYAGVAVVGMSVAMRSTDRFSTLVAAGLTTWIVGQAFVNLGVVVGVLPITGVPLPFVSAGGSSMVITMAATGMLVRIARQLR